MAAHLPGAGDIQAFWDNLSKGIGSIRRLSDEDLDLAGESAGLRANPHYVPAAAPLHEFDHFDAEFFGLSPKDAAIMDPQHRQFLEVAWEALENAGHPPRGFGGDIGVYAGCGMGSYFYFNICSNPELVDNTGMFLLRHTGNDKDFLSTRVSHIFDMKGPSIGLQTACSTSLVAVHYALQALERGECDMALAGGVTIELPHGRGYLYKENEILSPDGVCRAFDHRAEGTVFGSGAGVVVLRRLADAVADGDHIWAVVRGSAINNDGAAKAGYLAPSVDGQSTAVARALKSANVSARSIDYIECHGTGTYLGDPIEVAALTQAFRDETEDKGFCRIGSVKTNIGHLDTAAGVASLIKTSLALHHKEMPPTLGFEEPNPAMGIDETPFVVNDALTPWVSDGPRRAGVNSLGVGGTNAHVILEEAPAPGPDAESDWPFQLLTLSARSKGALDAASDNLAAHLEAHPDQNLVDVAFTLKEGRAEFERRRVVVAENPAEGAAALRDGDRRRVFTHEVVSENPEPVFMFPGGGAQYAGMARDLYDTEPVFREWMDKGLAILEPRLDYDLRALWLPEEDDRETADARLKTPSVQLPLIMIVEYALAQLWMSWGVKPTALIGHSMGENTAACLAGVMSLEDCIGLVHLRGSLFDTVAPGGMLSVSLSEDEVRPYIGDGLDIASINAPALTVVSGPDADLAALAERLQADEVDCKRIAINIAAHSRMLEPVLDRFRDYLAGISLNAPTIPIVSNRTGDWLSDADAMDPDYWVGHLRNAVLFEKGIGRLAENPDRIYIEVGPGEALASLSAQHADVNRNQVINTLRHPEDAVADDAYFVAMLGRVWACGGTFDWTQLWSADGPLKRVPLPTYPFQRSKYFIEPGKAVVETRASEWLMRLEDREGWSWRPIWKPAYPDSPVDLNGDISGAGKETWLLFADAAGLAGEVSKRLRKAGHRVVSVITGDMNARIGEFSYVISPEQGQEGYEFLVQDLAARDLAPTRIGHFWLFTTDTGARSGSSFFHRVQEQGFWSLFHFARAWGQEDGGPLHLTVITSDMMRVQDEALAHPEKTTVMGPVRVIPREFPGLSCSVLDLAAPRRSQAAGLVGPVLEELLAVPGNTVAAIRGDKRFAQSWQHVPLKPVEEAGIAEGSVVLVTGGYGGIGMTVAEELIRRHKAKVAFVSRQSIPPRADWDRIANGAADKLSRRLQGLLRLEALGGEVLALNADVSNIEEMTRAVAQVRETWGGIDGVVHAAGVIEDEPILSKSPSSVDAVFTPKIHGMQILNDLFPDGALDWMVLFSSSSTVTAPAGQVDYVAANEYLNAMAQARQGGKTRLTTIDWGLWSGVGMAAEAMDVRTGITAESVPVGAPLLDEATVDGAGNRRFTSTWRPEELWVLNEHRTKAGDALLPGTGYLELASQALRAQGEPLQFEIRNLTFFRPLGTSDGQETEVRLTLPRTKAGYDFTVESAASGAGFEVNAEASLSLTGMDRPDPIDLDAIRARIPVSEEAAEGETLTSPQEAHLNFGYRWRVLHSMALGQGEGLARLSHPEGDDAYHLHPGVMDLATGWAMGLIESYDADILWVPVSYGRVRVYGPLPDEIWSWVRLRKSGDTHMARFDIVLADETGQVAVEIRDFSIRQLSADAKFASNSASAAKVPVELRPLSPAEERLRHNISQGILPKDGGAFFLRAMASGLPQVLVSSLDLNEMVKQAAADSAGRADKVQVFSRPQLDSDYVEPEGEIERRLAVFWSELLGIEKVGAEDNFFDLGGHSLIAVRLFAMVKKAFAVEFPISVLFEAPTIRVCAQLIAEQTNVASQDEDTKADNPRKRRFTHLVPMHQGEGGTKTPFFLVAGMFGNVLNLRHLAHLLGDDRPFYGLQARGLYGGEEPHDDLVEAARDYIAEMRQVQPKGPYMLGGFSGGGITAYEIAQQLKAEGEEVAALILLDTPLPQRETLSKADKILIRLQEMKEQGVMFPVNWVRNKLEYKRAQAFKASHASRESEFHNVEIEAAFYQAIAKYQVQPWDGPLSLMRPPQIPRWRVMKGRKVGASREFLIPDNGWTLYAPSISVHEVPGDHDSMVLEPNVRVLAARMQEIVELAEKAGGHFLRAAE